MVAQPGIRTLDGEAGRGYQSFLTETCSIKDSDFALCLYHYYVVCIVTRVGSEFVIVTLSSAGN